MRCSWRAALSLTAPVLVLGRPARTAQIIPHALGQKLLKGERDGVDDKELMHAGVALPDHRALIIAKVSNVPAHLATMTGEEDADDD